MSGLTAAFFVEFLLLALRQYEAELKEIMENIEGIKRTIRTGKINRAGPEGC